MVFTPDLLQQTARLCKQTYQKKVTFGNSNALALLTFPVENIRDVWRLEAEVISWSQFRVFHITLATDVRWNQSDMW